MKTFIVLLPLFCLGAAGYAGQTNQLDLQRASTPLPHAVRAKEGPDKGPQTNTAPYVLRGQGTYGGVLPELQRRRTRFFKDPPAPPRPEFPNVAVNPVTGRAEGIILFSVKF